MAEKAKTAASRRKKREKEPAEKPVSLAPLSFEDALKGLVRSKPVQPKKTRRAR